MQLLKQKKLLKEHSQEHLARRPFRGMLEDLRGLELEHADDGSRLLREFGGR